MPFLLVMLVAWLQIEHDGKLDIDSVHDVNVQ